MAVAELADGLERGERLDEGDGHVPEGEEEDGANVGQHDHPAGGRQRRPRAVLRRNHRLCAGAEGVAGNAGVGENGARGEGGEAGGAGAEEEEVRCLRVLAQRQHLELAVYRRRHAGLGRRSAQLEAGFLASRQALLERPGPERVAGDSEDLGEVGPEEGLQRLLHLGAGRPLGVPAAGTEGRGGVLEGD
eukprot:scaffold8292_cov120-Isochrysis_galbana.AAC.9